MDEISKKLHGGSPKFMVESDFLGVIKSPVKISLNIHNAHTRVYKPGV